MELYMEPQNLAPDDILEISGYYWKTCTLHAAVSLDLFSIIGEGELSGEKAAECLNADRDGVERILNALSAMGLLHKRGSLFRNTQASMKYLVQDSPAYVGWMIMHHQHLITPWSQLDQAVMSGNPQKDALSVSSEKWRECFLKGMHTNARLQAPAVVSAIDLSEKANLLDLGGGPGTYAIHFCHKHPNLSAVVYDLPGSRPIAEETIREAGLADRIRFQAGDFHEDEIHGVFDVVWLSHILHAEGLENCYKIIQKAVDALKPGGMILIHDFILDENMDMPEFPALFSLNMLVVTDSGQAYSEKQIKDMLSTAGVQAITRLGFRGFMDSGIVKGTRAK